MTTASAGRAAATRSGVGPAASRGANTLAVASSPKAWTPPVRSCSAAVSRVSPGAARQAQPTTCAMVRGTAVATSRRLACTTFS